MIDPTRLVTDWRKDAEFLRQNGAEGQALAYERCADTLSEWFADWEDETLTLEQASQESQYSVTHLRRLVSQGKLRDRADSGATMLRRGDLPRKYCTQLAYTQSGS